MIELPAIQIPLFLSVTMVFVIGMSLYLVVRGGDSLVADPDYKGEWWFPLLLAVALAYWMGIRPFETTNYGDSVNYAITYRILGNAVDATIAFSLKEEWAWGALMIICNALHLDVHGFFLVVAMVYVLSAMWAMKIINPTSPMLGFLFVVSSLFFIPFGINGLRNGLACHLVLLAMAQLFADRRIFAGVLALLAFGIHRSTILPIAGCIAAVTVMKNPKWAFYVWLGSIGVSLVAGQSVMGLLSSIGFDSRLESYSQGFNNAAFSKVGFRWDFLLFSTPPILLWLWVSVKNKVRDGWYNALMVTYMLANALWILMIRAEYTNRIAYLSWFLFPAVYSYPFCNMKVWGDAQNFMAGIMLLGYFFITYFMLMFFL